MGIFTELCLLPLAPVRGVVWVADRMADAAEEELRAPAAVHMRIRALNDILEAGEISLHEFEQEEERLLDLLEPPVPPAPAGRADATPVPGRHR
ncbi:gas vesicle protein GvpG [Streptomyces sp. DSM 42041]|uniref:Gas vesicle protein GvpG n=1 Tax=Streptomyces hazeniae TaxID=3075538 RepID=A0ABU2P1M6_9ACTN|nr:gas vesicle protein GvpG [Streptomyces sp. DSM 42041]MDT0382343.1 gas vesicle protein GvpG [Streptomyces sp. DSM 42041]